MTFADPLLKALHWLLTSFKTNPNFSNAPAKLCRGVPCRHHKPQYTSYCPCSLGPRSPAFFLFLADPSFCFASCSPSPCSHPSQATNSIPQPLPGTGHCSHRPPCPQLDVLTHLGKHSVKICNSSSKTLSVSPWGLITSVLFLARAPGGSPLSVGTQIRKCGRENQGGWVTFLWEWGQEREMDQVYWRE